VEGFNFILEDYVFQEIKNGMMIYMKNYSDIPAPSDLIKIMDEKRSLEVTSVSPEKLVDYFKKGIPLSSAQKKKLIDLNMMDEAGNLCE